MAEGADLERKPKTRRRRKSDSPRRAQRREKLAQDFYGSALDAAERIELEAATDVEGLDREIALLRMKLREAVSERPEDLELMLRGMTTLVNAVSARFRLSKRAEEELSESIAGVVRGVGGLLSPESFADE